MNARNFPVKLLRSEKYGNKAFIENIPHTRFEDIMKNNRFDTRSRRGELLQSDKFALMSWVSSKFLENSQQCFIPEESLTIDKQLFPTKDRCRFTQYMLKNQTNLLTRQYMLKNQTNLLTRQHMLKHQTNLESNDFADLKTKHCLNIKPYLG